MRLTASAPAGGEHRQTGLQQSGRLLRLAGDPAGHGPLAISLAQLTDRLEVVLGRRIGRRHLPLLSLRAASRLLRPWRPVLARQLAFAVLLESANQVSRDQSAWELFPGPRTDPEQYVTEWTASAVSTHRQGSTTGRRHVSRLERADPFRVAAGPDVPNDGLGSHERSLAGPPHTPLRLVPAAARYIWYQVSAVSALDSHDRFSKDVEDVLIASGWFPGRRVDASRWSQGLDHPEQPDGFRLSDAARAALEEFGGLKVRQKAPGVDYARSSFDLDPLTLMGEEDRFEGWSRALGSRLYPLGQDYYGTYFLAMDEQGRVFSMANELHHVGRDIAEAVENLILGRRPADFFKVTLEEEA